MRLHFPVGALALACAGLCANCGGSSHTVNQQAASNKASVDPESQVERVLKTLPDNGFKAEIVVDNAPTSLRRGQRTNLTVRVKNISSAEWPMRGRIGDGMYQVNLGDHWFRAERKEVRVDERSFLPKAVKPGEDVNMQFTLIAPDEAGEFTVELDIVQEGVAWFREKGSQPARLKIKVEP